MNIPYRFSAVLGHICFTLFGDWQVSGKLCVPPLGPLIVVSNHISNADPPVLISSIPRQLAFLAKDDLFNNPMLNMFFKSIGAHPLSRSGPDVGAMRWASRMINKDHAVLLFPEGTRSITGTLRRGLPGSAYLALQTQAPILPVAITGTERIPGFWRVAFPMANIRVKIGRPFTLPQIDGRPSKAILQSLSDMIMMRIADLLPPDYRGYYASSLTFPSNDADATP
ncbi:1-acyl-sn-glycerol-3-phosphate acyltransferase [SAR202 cluster bacterium AD-804-J14_MRT_500m]|nr:1-acyl-sn-glycerol-3-phosphate acyltransferase [SAR202 cluster bacterium AD-804-J14_MRT_500m]